MIDRVILQVPMSKQLKKQAEAVSRSNGFSSLQETIRLFLSKLANHELTLKVVEPIEERLSPRAERRYLKMIKDIKEERGVVKTEDARDFLRKLRS